jgi:hypothetical protein
VKFLVAGPAEKQIVFQNNLFQRSGFWNAESGGLGSAEISEIEDAAQLS